MIIRLSLQMWKIINLIYFKIKKVNYHHAFSVRGFVRIVYDMMNQRVLEFPRIYLGKSIHINSGWKYNMIGKGERTILRTINEGEIWIGDSVAMSNVTIVSMKKVTIENKVMIGGGVSIWDTDFHSLDRVTRTEDPYNDIKCKEIIIKNGAFIGAGTTILKGSIIGENSIIGANSVVAGTVPDNEIWAGNPARFIRRL